MSRLKTLKQYFTPAAVADFIIAGSRVNSDVKIIDPSVGDGSFICALGNRNFKEFTGIDIDGELTQRLQEEYNSNPKIRLINGNALVAGEKTKDGSYDLAVGNPPFSNQKNRVRDKGILEKYELGRKSQSLEILFMERFIQFLKPGGQLRIILPNNVFANSNLKYARELIIERLDNIIVVSLPRRIFKKTSAHTSILFGVKSVDPVKSIRLVRIDSLQQLEAKSIDDIPGAIEINPNDALDRMDPGYHFKKRTAQRMLDKCPYPLQPIGELSEVTMGFSRYGEYKKQIREGPPTKDAVRFHMARSFSPLGYRPGKGEFHIMKNGPIYSEKALVNEGDVLFIRVGKGCIGRAFCIPSEILKGQADDWIFIIKTRNVNPYYLAFYINSTVGKAFIDAEKQGTGTESISRKRFCNIPVPLITDDKQKRFEESLRTLYNLFEEGDTKGAEKMFEKMDNELTDILHVNRE